jgi:ABC-type nickel/cobalt efflux system permease component RcnA
MFGLDDWIASYSDGTSIALVLLVAIFLGLRHATDPDHLAAVTALIATGHDRAARAAARLGLAWGLGHGLSLALFGLPVVVFGTYLPERIQQSAETAIAAVIVFLAVRLLVRWRRGAFHAHVHSHAGDPAHVHLHSHSDVPSHAHHHRNRSPMGAFGIGLVHGMGGSAGVGILIVAAVEATWLAVASLIVLAVFTAVSMALVTGGFGLTIESRSVRRSFNVVAPALGVLSLCFGMWYGSAAWGVTPYPL